LSSINIIHGGFSVVYLVARWEAMLLIAIINSMTIPTTKGANLFYTFGILVSTVPGKAMFSIAH